jgi:ferredoxin-thioredoxin reductase catalytic subunit
MTEAEQLLERLKPIQEAKGIFFNNDPRACARPPDALLLNKKRYGYMSCPCRIASGDREKAGTSSSM